MALLAGCQPEDPLRTRLFAFGTQFDIQLVNVAKPEALEIFRNFDQQLQTWHVDWHAWQDGELTRTNQELAAGRSVVVSQPLLKLIRASQELHRRSLGYFDPGAGKLIGAWGFHSDTYPVTTPRPSAAKVAEWQQAPGSVSSVVINESRVRSTLPQTQLDFGGLAKGAALQILKDQLLKKNVSNALLNFGGDVLALGQGPRGAWRVAIANPKSDTPLVVITMTSGESLFSSGSSYRYRLDEDQSSGHIMDPKRGVPSVSLIAASVLHADPLTADAAATALLASGVRWAEVAQSMQVTQALVIAADGECTATPAMAARMGTDVCRTVSYTAPLTSTPGDS